jgi:putative FmdB family regulatory protein
MPLYSYACSNKKCEEVRDLAAPMKDRDAWVGTPCPTCDNGELRRVYTPYSILNAGLGDIA